MTGLTRLSLRGRLFILIILPLIVVAAFAGGVRYVMAERLSQRLYDNTLLVVALTISRDVVLSEGDILAEQLMDSLTRSLGDPVYYRITGPAGRFVTGYTDAPPVPKSVIVRGGVPTFYDSVSLGVPVRAVSLREFISEPQFGGWVTVDVWQTVRQRNALSLELLVQAVLLLTVVIIAAALLVWFGINRGLRPLFDLEDAVAQRSPDDLRPIRRPVPVEMSRIILAMNALFGRLTEAFALRDAFISDAAHQLRNPIAALQAQAEAAITAPGEAELRRRTTDLAELARRTGRLTNQLLSMEKARGRQEAGLREMTDILALVQDVAARFAATALRGGIEVSFEHSGTPRPVPLDRVMFEEAVENLLVNARTYGCPDGGTIRISLTFEDADVSLAVCDDGPGIPAEAQVRVFDRFVRLNDDASGGCGLGLAIVQHVAEMHGGGARIAPTALGTCVLLTVSDQRVKGAVHDGKTL